MKNDHFCPKSTSQQISNDSNIDNVLWPQALESVTKGQVKKSSLGN